MKKLDESQGKKEKNTRVKICTQAEDIYKLFVPMSDEAYSRSNEHFLKCTQEQFRRSDHASAMSAKKMGNIHLG